MHKHNVVVLGSGGVGKSALTVRFVQDVFVTSYDPTIEDCYLKTVEYGKEKCVLEILDTAGTEQFTSMQDLYIRNGQGFLLVYSVTSQTSFEDTKHLFDQVLAIKQCDQVPIVLVGNKVDLEDQRTVNAEEGRNWASQWNAGFFETSAKLNVNIDEVFRNLIRQIDLTQPDQEKLKPKKKPFYKRLCTIL